MLHVGTEKTGSSYLQKLCGRNRAYLQENRIWFPHAGEHETRLQKGTISPGNAHSLTQHIRRKSWGSVTTWLKERVETAKQRACHSLLLSNEQLFAEMTGERVVASCQSAAAEAGITDVNCLLIIRDPVDQALSLYKHRNKSGRAGTIAEWLQKGYSLPARLENFIGQVDQSDIQLCLRKYEKNTGSLTKAFFLDWLGIEEPPAKIESIVNPSLSLSELAVIRHIVSSRPGDQRAYYSKFLAVAADQKANDGDIEAEASAEIENYLSKFNEVWEKLDVRLASDGGIKVPSSPRGYLKNGARQFSFSEAQLEALSEAHAQSATIRYAAGTWIHRLGLGKLFRSFMSRLRRESGGQPK